MTHAGTLRAPTCIIQWTPLVRRCASHKMALSSCPSRRGWRLQLAIKQFSRVARVPFVCIGDEPLTESSRCGYSQMSAMRCVPRRMHAVSA
jgi:hypothetical protein